jgi:hypothetical protein
VENNSNVCKQLSGFSTFPQALLLLLDKYIVFKLIELVKVAAKKSIILGIIGEKKSGADVWNL